MNAQQRAKLNEAMQLIADVLATEDTPLPEAAAPQTDHTIITDGRRPIAWGRKVSPVFRERVWWVCDQLGMDPDFLMACMAFESGGSFSPSIRNAAGSGATGLIQFMPATAISLGTTTDVLARMSAEDQLNFVYKYFRPYAGRLKTLADTYMAILWPAAVGKPEGHVLWDRNSKPTTYRQNSGLDANRDGTITKLEAATKVLARYTEGRKPENMA